MNIEKISIKNFRLLKDVALSIEPKTTVIVGRNNSGKTSLTELIRRLLSEKTPSFRLEDFSLSVCENFWNAFESKHKGSEDEKIREALPNIEMELVVGYDKEAKSLGALSEFIIDLNPDCVSAIISIKYKLGDGKIDSLFTELVWGKTTKEDFFKKMKERIPRLYVTTLEAVDPNDRENTKQLEWACLHKLLKSGFINAQRGLDDETYKDKDVLGKILEVLFTTAGSESADKKDKKTAEELKDAIASIQSDIDKGFNKQLEGLVPSLSLFGYPGLSDPGLSTETTLDVERLLTNNTKVRYSGVEGVSLPEAFNGLGARNLVFILFKLFEFFKSYKACESLPGVHLVFIEEPEAHLHPQMQEVFIRQLDLIAKAFADTYNGGIPWPVQFVVSTHSSHIANETRFDSIRYFIAVPDKEKSITCNTKIKDLGKATLSDKTFLHKYLTLTRCDLFFADKAILIEGPTERILLPSMIEKIDSERPTNKLSSQYVSVVEVDGAHAHIFYDLLDFLELQTLVITDLDTGDNTNANKACKVSRGTHTSNSCIKNWFNKSDITPVEIIGKSSSDKTKNICRIAYEVPEAGKSICGRSFEGAFMLANPRLFILDESSEVNEEEDVWTKTSKLQDKKTGFALEYAITQTEWKVPLYIKEGLNWLAGESAPLEVSKIVSIAKKEATKEIKTRSKK